MPQRAALKLFVTFFILNTGIQALANTSNSIAPEALFEASVSSSELLPVIQTIREMQCTTDSNQFSKVIITDQKVPAPLSTSGVALRSQIIALNAENKIQYLGFSERNAVDPQERRDSEPGGASGWGGKEFYARSAIPESLETSNVAAVAESVKEQQNQNQRGYNLHFIKNIETTPELIETLSVACTVQ